MRTTARFPAVASAAAHYESFFLKATRPGGGQGVWIRHTVDKRPDDEAKAAVWLTWFDAGSRCPRAGRAAYTAADLAAGPTTYIRIGDTVLEHGRARGTLADGPLTASWNLTFADDHAPLRHLPHGFLYSGRLPRTKLLSPYPSARFTGTLEIDGERIELGGWPGTVGHNWGSEHAERWVWIQAGDLDGAGGFLDVAAGRVRVGPVTTPWIANGVVRVEGDDLRLGGFGRLRATRLEAGADGCSFAFAGADVAVHGRVHAPGERFVDWTYEDPGGGEHRVRNCSIADLELTVERARRAPVRARVAGAAAYELGLPA